MTPPAHGEAEDIVRLLLTKNPAQSFSSSWCQVGTVSRLKNVSFVVETYFSMFISCLVTIVQVLLSLGSDGHVQVVITVPAALVNIWPGIGPLPLCCLQLSLI